MNSLLSEKRVVFPAILAEISDALRGLQERREYR